MTIVARFAISIALLFTVSSQAQAFEWPHPFGHDVEGSIGSRIVPFGSVELLYDHSNVDNDGESASRGILADARLGADLTITDRLVIRGEGRLGDDHRTGYVNLGGGNFDQNFDFSISQLSAQWRIPTRFNLVDTATLTGGRQTPGFNANVLYPGSVLDPDLNLDGVQFDWDCGCEECGFETGGSVGGWKLNRAFDMLPSGPNLNAFGNDFETETARLITADLHSTWTPNEDVQLQSYVNYYGYKNSDDGFGGNADTTAGIIDSPDILHAGINTQFGIGGQRLTLAGELIHNLDASRREYGFTGGVGFGFYLCDRWQRISYVYQDIGAWSLVPGLAQDDHRNVRAGYTGHVVQAEWNTTDRVRLLVDAFIANPDNSIAANDAWRFRTGVEIQFD